MKDVNVEMEQGLKITPKNSGIPSRASALRCIFKQRSISSTLSLPVRIAPAWSRMLRFGNTTKFKIDDFFEVNFLDYFIKFFPIYQLHILISIATFSALF